MTDFSSPDRGSALIVEDEFLIALDLEATMQALGFEVCGLAPTAKEAVSIAMRNPPDVVLMDVYLDGTRQGIEAARWLRNVCEVPIIFVTAHSDDGTLERIRQAVPGSPIVSKPIYRERLAAAIAEIVH
ncbi:MAG: response regulator [Methyloceanibacter sp.]|jgi:CheY-like chemotaxis protein